MTNWIKKIFNSDIITSDFLNSLQDHIIKRGPKLVPIIERPVDGPVPATRGSTKTLYATSVLFGSYNNVGVEFELMTGDLLLGIPSGNLGTVTELSGNTITVVGLGTSLIQ